MVNAKALAGMFRLKSEKAVDEYCKNASHGAKGKSSYLTAWIFEFLKTRY